MTNPVDNLERAKQLKQLLLDFVLDAEGDLAIALEVFSAEHLARFAKAQFQGTVQTDLMMDCFLTQGCINTKTPLELFLSLSLDLTPQDLTLLARWTQNFTGLFTVTEVLTDGFGLKNWLTDKHYRVKSIGLQPSEQIARLAPEEIVLTRIAPITDQEWILFSPLILMGRLGKPKLAVAVGNFKKHHPEDLYGDAPELLQEAWRSVEQHHHEWLTFFGSEEVTLSGYKASQQLKQFQADVVQRRLDEAGLDHTLLFSEKLVSEKLEVADTAPILETNVAPKGTQAHAEKPAMVAPQINLPDALLKAEQVTLLTHPQWGQMYLSSYPQLKVLLQNETIPNGQERQIVRHALEAPEMNAYLWHRLADQFSGQLEGLLRTVLDQPEFNLDQGLDALLQSYGKPLKPVLPETASVPVPLHRLFQDAFLEVHKTHTKAKPKTKTSKGFQR